MKLTGNRCQCTACGEHFNGVQPFDAHRIGEHGVNRHCMAVAQLLAEGFEKNAAGFWMTDSRAQRAARHSAATIPARFGHRARGNPPPDKRGPNYAAGGAT